MQPAQVLAAQGIAKINGEGMNHKAGQEQHQLQLYHRASCNGPVQLGPAMDLSS